jgi:ribosomal-protein-alanine N-acetyltransferase
MKIPDRIETDRLVIRPFTAADTDGFVAFMTNEEATKFLFMDDQKTEEGAKAFLEYVIASYSSDKLVFALAIASKTDDRLIGSCGVSSIGEEGVYECYYGLAPEHWGNGYATEATRALLDYCFSNYSMTEIRTYMDPANPNSAGVAKRIGMGYSGRSKHPVFGDDCEVYAIRNAERGKQGK